jgi:hypothetical protein
MVPQPNIIRLPTTQPVDALALTAGTGSVIVRSAGRILAVEEAPLLRRPAEMPDIDPAAEPPDKRVRKLAADVPDGAPLGVDPAGKAITYFKGGTLFVVSPETPAIVRRCEIAELHDAHLSGLAVGDGDLVLCVTMDLSDLDLIYYRLDLVDLDRGRIVRPALAKAAVNWTVGWSAGAGTFFAYEGAGERLLRIAPGAEKAEEVLVPRMAGTSVSAPSLHPHPESPLVAVVLNDATADSNLLLVGHIAEKSVEWGRPSFLPDGALGRPVWHPSPEVRRLALERSSKRGGLLSVVDTRGGEPIDAKPPSGWPGGPGAEPAWASDGSAAFLPCGGGVGVWRMSF